MLYPMLCNYLMPKSFGSPQQIRTSNPWCRNRTACHSGANSHPLLTSE
jgi:hypothetical protein